MPLVNFNLSNSQINNYLYKKIDIMNSNILDYNNIQIGSFYKDPYPHFIAKNILSPAKKIALKEDYPLIDKPGFFPLDLLTQQGSFAELIEELKSKKFVETLSNVLGINLIDKPQLITVRKWSTKKDGRIHNDGASKIVTALIYLNDEWSNQNSDGNFRVLNDDSNFDNYVAEISPNYGSFVAFVRTEDSWHGHKLFIGERRVLQITWLNSYQDLERKKKRGKFSLFVKNLLSKVF